MTLDLDTFEKAESNSIKYFEYLLNKNYAKSHSNDDKRREIISILIFIVIKRQSSIQILLRTVPHSVHLQVDSWL